MADRLVAPPSRVRLRAYGCAALWIFFAVGSVREFYFLRPVEPQRPHRGGGIVPAQQQQPRRPTALGQRGHRGRRRHDADSNVGSLKFGTEALPRTALATRNATTFVLPNGQCVQRAALLPSLSCSLPECNRTRREGKLYVLTNGASREWVGYLRFELADIALRPGARLVDVELELHGTGLCHRRASWGNFTHQLHLLRAQQVPSALALNKPYPRRLTAQWSRMPVADNFRLPLNLNGNQLLTIRKVRVAPRLPASCLPAPRLPATRITQALAHDGDATHRAPPPLS